MARLVFFDPAATPQRVTKLTGKSVNEGPILASGRSDFVLNPDLVTPGLIAQDITPREVAVDSQGNERQLSPEIIEERILVPVKYWKHEGGAVLAMTQAERDAQDTAQSDAQELQRKESAKRHLDTGTDLGADIRAVLKVMRRELNELRDLHALPALKFRQLKNRTKNKIDAETDPADESDS